MAKLLFRKIESRAAATDQYAQVFKIFLGKGFKVNAGVLKGFL